MTSSKKSIVIVGAGAAGLSAAEGLRRLGFEGRLTIVADEPGQPCDRPALSKQILAGTWEPERASLLPPRRRQLIAAEWLTGHQATGVDLAARTVQIGDHNVHYDELIIATGVRPRTVPSSNLTGLHVLRTVDDSLRLRARIVAGTRLTVIGGGFLGLEAAATVAEIGAVVTVVEPLHEPLAARLGVLASNRLLGLHRSRGVQIRSGSHVAEFLGRSGLPPEPFHGSSGEPGLSQAISVVRLSDDTQLSSDVVLLAIGSTPCVDWLEGSGLDIDDGLVCDEYCSAADGVWAAGDVARWFHPQFGRHVRLEHRMNANEQAQAVATNIMGERRPFAPVPFFWTDHFGTKIQVWGTVSRGAREHVAEGSIHEDSFVVTFHDRDSGNLVGVLGWNATKLVAPYRESLEAHARHSAQAVSSI